MNRCLRRGICPRPRKERENLGAEFNVRELERMARSWLDFHKRAWKRVKAGDWKEMVRDCPQEAREGLRELLERTGKHLSEVGQTCETMREKLTELVQKLS